MHLVVACEGLMFSFFTKIELLRFLEWLEMPQTGKMVKRTSFFKIPPLIFAGTMTLGWDFEKTQAHDSPHRITSARRNPDSQEHLFLGKTNCKMRPFRYGYAAIAPTFVCQYVIICTHLLCLPSNQFRRDWYREKARRARAIIPTGGRTRK